MSWLSKRKEPYASPESILKKNVLSPLKRCFPHPTPTNAAPSVPALDPRLALKRLHPAPCLSGGGSTDARGTPPGPPAPTRAAGHVQMLFSDRITSSRELAKSLSRQNGNAKLV